MTRPVIMNGDPRVQELMTEVAVLKNQLSERDKALHRQAEEYERRLSELNNSHARAERALVDADAKLTLYLPRELFERELIGWRDWRNQVDIKLSALDGIISRAENIDGRLKVIEDWAAKAIGGMTTVTLLVKIAWAVGGSLVTAIAYFLASTGLSMVK